MKPNLKQEIRYHKIFHKILQSFINPKVRLADLKGEQKFKAIALLQGKERVK